MVRSSLPRPYLSTIALGLMAKTIANRRSIGDDEEASTRSHTRIVNAASMSQMLLHLQLATLASPPSTRKVVPCVEAVFFGPSRAAGLSRLHRE
jgi:hypothetical protein